MHKLLVIPDVHGRTFWKYALDHIDEYKQIIFLGDYLDPYPHEGITFNNAVLNFSDILMFKKDNWNKVTLLLGNHDLHYMDMGFMDCSRLNYSRRAEMNAAFKEYDNYFQLIYVTDGIMFSHAGVYTEWLTRNGLTLADVLKGDINRCFLEQLSTYRGGWDSVGSCVWADIRESIKHEVDTTFYQIVGHTQLSEEPSVGEHIACLDVRRCFEIDIKTKQITEVNDELNIQNESTSN